MWAKSTLNILLVKLRSGNVSQIYNLIVFGHLKSDDDDDYIDNCMPQLPPSIKQWYSHLMSDNDDDDNIDNNMPQLPPSIKQWYSHLMSDNDDDDDNIDNNMPQLPPSIKQW